MGPAGVVSRILAARFGSAWTYAAEGIAPGQLPAAHLVEQYRYRHVTARSRVYAVVGRPVGHSLSPAMHNAAPSPPGAGRGVRAARSGGFRRLPWAADALGRRGVSVTAPFKEDGVGRAARGERRSTAHRRRQHAAARGPTGAGRHEHGRRGFPRPARRRRARRGRASILGAGGAARGRGGRAGFAGAVVTLHARRPGGGRRRRLCAWTPASAGWPPGPGSWDLLVNATPVGTWPDVDAVRRSRHRSCMTGLVYDLVYNPSGHGAAARAAGQRVSHDRRARHAGGAGSTPVRVVDGRRGPGRGHARGGPPRAGGVPGRRAESHRAMKHDDLSSSSWNWRGAARSCRSTRRSSPTCSRPVSAFLKIAEHSDYAFLLESVEGGEQVAATRSSARTRSWSCARGHGRRT